MYCCSCALLVRGQIQVSDVNRNIERMRSKIRTIYWNHDGFKVGICATPSARKLPVELLCLANNTAISVITAADYEDYDENDAENNAAIVLLHANNVSTVSAVAQYNAHQAVLADAIDYDSEDDW